MSAPDPTLLQIFAAEQAEHLQSMRGLIAALAPPVAGSAAIGELLRRAHTLKGAARAAGFGAIESAMHSMESVFAAMNADTVALTDSLTSVVYRALDFAEDVVTAFLAGRPAPNPQPILRELEGAAESGRSPAPAPSPEPATPRAQPSGVASGGEFVRVRAALLDELMSASSELRASAAAPDAGDPKTLSRAEEAFREWSLLRRRASTYLRKHEEDPEFLPVLECIQAADRSFQRLLSGSRLEALEQRRRDWEHRQAANRLDEIAMRLRMVTAETVLGGFGPMLRDLALESGKQVEFRAEGLELPADRLLLQSLKDPVMHLLRNAISHGVESPGERRAAGKEPLATIRLVLRSQGDRLQLAVEDDGRGLDEAALAEEASRRGIFADADSRQRGEAAADLIFLPGFTTSSSLGTLSGRGMGLAIVRHEVNRFHGDISVRSFRGKGTAITLSLPLSVSKQPVLLVEAGTHTFGFLSSFVRQLRRVKPAEIATFEGKPAIRAGTQAIRLLRLADRLHGSAEASPDEAVAAAPTNEGLYVVIVQSRDRIAGIVVDRLVEVRDVVIKPLGLPEDLSGLAAGGVAQPDGSVAVVLKVPELLDVSQELAASAPSQGIQTPQPQERRHTILVVDDSMTTRSLEKNILEAHGYLVRLAVDGQEALESLRAQPVDLVITDLNMPGMDGFQLLEEIRRDKSLAELPVIIVSSREDRLDQDRGLTLGADAYITKRKFDQRKLLETVKQIL